MQQKAGIPYLYALLGLVHSMKDERWPLMYFLQKNVENSITKKNTIMVNKILTLIDWLIDYGWSRLTHLSLRYLWDQVSKFSSNSKESNPNLTWFHSTTGSWASLNWRGGIKFKLQFRKKTGISQTSKRRELNIIYPVGWRHT